MIRLVAVFGSAFLLGCAVTPPPLPNSDDFTMPPEDLAAKYEVVKRFHPDHLTPTGKVTLSEIEQQWGDARASEIDWKNTFVQYGAISSIVYVVGDGSAELVAGGLGIALLVMPPHRRYIWEKGDYRVSGTFVRPLWIGKPRLVSWEWEHRARGLAGYRNWLARNNESGLYFKLAFGMGGDTLAVSADGKSVVDAGEHSDLTFGWRFPIRDTRIGVKVSAGMRVGGASNGSNLTQYPLSGLVEYRLRDSRFRLGGGIVYALAPSLSIDGGLSGTQKYDFDDGFGGIAQLEYRQNAKFGLGLRYELLDLTSEVLGTASASSFGFYLARYF